MLFIKLTPSGLYGLKETIKRALTPADPIILTWIIGAALKPITCAFNCSFN